jgi:hypothetical protein
MTVPYHADVIGSLLRPRYLSEARAALAAGRMSNEEFKRIEDRAVDQAIAMQEGCGLDVVNDGELRRFSFLDHLLGDMEGVTDIPGATIRFHAADPAQDWEWQPPVTVTGRIRPKGPMMTIEEFSYARGRARAQVKITMPSPLVIYSAWSPEHSRPAYSDPFELFADAAEIIRAEAAELARLGCTYIQIDSPDLGTLVDPESRALREGLGMDTERTWIATGGYDYTADKVFPGRPTSTCSCSSTTTSGPAPSSRWPTCPTTRWSYSAWCRTRFPTWSRPVSSSPGSTRRPATSAVSGSRCPLSAGSRRSRSEATSSARTPSSASSNW